jgi:hypothetical protein
LRNIVLLDNVSGVAQLIPNAIRQREGALKRHDIRIAVNQCTIIVLLQPCDGIQVPLRLGPVDQNVADGTEDQWAGG